MRCVPIKQLEPHDLQALHRVRERLITARTALVHEIRGRLSEYGSVLPQGMPKFRVSVVRPLEAERAKLTPLSAELFRHFDEALLALEPRVAYDQEKLQARAQAHPLWQRGQAMPGIGPLTATAILAAELGLVPREHSTGGTPRLLGISKRGDVYLRKRLVHGARATRRWVDTKQDERSQWLNALIARRGKNRAAVA